MKQKQFKRRNNLMARTQRSIEERKKRTHLLCQIGGTVEKVLDEVVFIDRGHLVLQSSVDQIREEKGMSVDALFREVFKC